MFAAGANHSLVILEGGELWSAGGNSHGQLGIGNTTAMKSFVKVDLGEKKAVSVAAGNFQSMVLLEGGEVWSAGWNDYGQLGIGNTIDMNSFVKVDLGEKKAVSVAAGYYHSFVILEGGEVWSAGCNHHGQLGIGNTTAMNSFVKVDLGEKKAVSVAAGAHHSMVILEGGEVWSAGWNGHGQLGIGNTTDMKSFVKVHLGEKNAVSVAAGAHHSMVILEGGEVWSAGWNDHGQLGIGNTTDMKSFVKVDLGERKADGGVLEDDEKVDDGSEDLAICLPKTTEQPSEWNRLLSASFESISQHDPSTAKLLCTLDAFYDDMRELSRRPYVSNRQQEHAWVEEQMRDRGVLEYADLDHPSPMVLFLVDSFSEKLHLNKDLFGTELGEKICFELATIEAEHVHTSQTVSEVVSCEIEECIYALFDGIRAQGQGSSAHLINHEQEERRLQVAMRKLSDTLSSKYVANPGDYEKERQDDLQNMLNLFDKKFDVILDHNELLRKLLRQKRCRYEELHSDANSAEQATEAQLNGLLRRCADLRYNLATYLEELKDTSAKEIGALEAESTDETNTADGCDAIAAVRASASKAAHTQKLCYMRSQQEYRIEKAEALCATGISACLQAEASAKDAVECCKLAQRLLQQWGCWMDAFFDRVEFKTEENFHAFAKDVPADYAKCMALLDAAEIDLKRRQAEMQHALSLNYELAKTEEMHLGRLRRGGPTAQEEFTQREAKLNDLQSQIEFLDSEVCQVKLLRNGACQAKGRFASKVRGLMAVQDYFTLDKRWLDEFFFTKTFQGLTLPRSLESGSATSVEIGDHPKSSLMDSEKSDLDDSCSVGNSSGWQIAVCDSVSNAISGPEAFPRRECILHGGILQTVHGQGIQAEMSKNVELQSLNDSGKLQSLLVTAAHRHPAYSRDIATITLEIEGEANAQYEITAEHPVRAQRNGAMQAVFEARELCNDHLVQVVSSLGELSLAKVHSVRSEERSVKVVEIRGEQEGQLLLKAINSSLHLVISTSPKLPPCVASTSRSFLSVKRDYPETSTKALSEPCGGAAQPEKLYVMGGTAHDGPTRTRVDANSDAQAGRFAAHAQDIRVSHVSQECTRPCKYFVKGNCRNGDECSRCHHPEHLQVRLVHSRRRRR